MTIQIALLALASALRLSSFVAVYALVREPSSSRLMTAYVIAGLAFTIAVGLAIVWVFKGADLQVGTGNAKAIAEITAGVLALGLAAAVARGRVATAGREDRPAAGGRWERLRQHQATIRQAAIAGPVTHIPGLLYIIALDLIVSQEPGVVGEVVEVGVYNVLWFAVPIVTLAICIFDPPAASRYLQGVERSARAHAKAIVTLVAAGLGTWLLIDGLTKI